MTALKLLETKALSVWGFVAVFVTTHSLDNLETGSLLSRRPSQPETGALVTGTGADAE